MVEPPVNRVDQRIARTPMKGGLTKSRIEALCDGVFAIAMTLMAFSIKVPSIPRDADNARLAAVLFELWPQFVTYIISFVMLGVYWIGHHNQFHYIRHSDRVLLWINVVFLMFVTLIPFSTEVLGQNRGQPVAVVFYGVNLTILGFILQAQWWYATTNHRLTDPDLDLVFVRLFKNRIQLGLFFLLISIAISLVSTRLSLLVFAAIAIFYILPGHVDRYWTPKK